MGWGGLVSVPWGGGPWGLGHSIASVSPGQVPDEGGIEIEILGSFAPGIRATVTVAGADCPYPSALGGADAANTIGAGAFPVASGDGTRICAIVPQTTVGWHDLTVQQPGLPLLTLAGAIETVRRDWWTRLHTLRNAFPAPPFADKTIGARRLELEGRYGQVTEDGQPVPVLEGLLHALAGALLEASATLYTRLAAAPFRSGSVARVRSSQAADVGQICTVYGRDLLGADVSEAVVLAGLAWVSTTQIFAEVTWAELDVEAVGSVTIADDAGTAPERIVIRPGFWRKAAGALQEGDTTIVVEGNYRFPDHGWLAFAGERLEFNARVCSAECNYFTLGPWAPGGGISGPGTGVLLPHDCGEMVADAANVVSAVELGRRMMLPEFSEGRYLSAVARRWGGIERPDVPLPDDLFRALFAAVSYGPRGTLRILTLLLDAIVGAGWYEIIEDPVNFSESWVGGAVSRVLCAAGHPCTVFVNWGALLRGGDEQGKAFLCGGEPRTSTGVATVDTVWNILLPYGVYTAADLAAGLGRTNNYCDFYSPAGDGSGPGAPPDEYNSAGGLFLPADDGKDLEISGSAAAYEDGVFRVTYSDAWTVFLSGVPRAHGTVVGGSLDIFTVDTAPAALGVPFASCPFGPDDVGKLVTVLDTMAGAPVTRTIGEYIDKRRVRMTVPWPAACTDASWCFSPQPWGGASNWRIARGSAAGSTITLARALPGAATAVVCDYTAVRSAMIPLRSSEPHAAPTAARPFYLSDSGAWLLQLLDDLTVAGVIPEAGDPHA